MRPIWKLAFEQKKLQRKLNEMQLSDFPDDSCLQRARLFNHALHASAKHRLMLELNSHEEFAEQIFVVRTRQAARALLIDINKQVLLVLNAKSRESILFQAKEFVSKGLLAEEECHRTMKAIERTMSRVEHLVYVPHAKLIDQLYAVPWMQNGVMKDVPFNTKLAICDMIMQGYKLLNITSKEPYCLTVSNNQRLASSVTPTSPPMICTSSCVALPCRNTRRGRCASQINPSRLSFHT